MSLIRKSICITSRQNGFLVNIKKETEITESEYIRRLLDREIDNKDKEEK